MTQTPRPPPPPQKKIKTQPCIIQLGIHVHSYKQDIYTHQLINQPLRMYPVYFVTNTKSSSQWVRLVN